MAALGDDLEHSVVRKRVLHGGQIDLRAQRARAAVFHPPIDGLRLEPTLAVRRLLALIIANCQEDEIGQRSAGTMYRSVHPRRSSSTRSQQPGTRKGNSRPRIYFRADAGDGFQSSETIVDGRSTFPEPCLSHRWQNVPFSRFRCVTSASTDGTRRSEHCDNPRARFGLANAAERDALPVLERCTARDG